MKKTKQGIPYYEIGNVYYPILYKVDRDIVQPKDHTDKWRKILRSIKNGV